MAVRHPTSFERVSDGIDFDDSPILLGGDRTTDPAPYANRVQIYPKRDGEGDLDLYLLDEMNRVTRLTNSGVAFASASDITTEAATRAVADTAEAAARLAADTAEAAARIAAISAEAATRVTADGLEGAARMAADAALQSNLIAAVGTGSVDAIPKRTGANTLGDSSIKEGASGIEPVTDQAKYLGTTAKRFLAVITKQGIYNYNNASDANETSSLSATALAFGAGGASAPDAILTRPSAGILTVTGKMQQATAPATGVDLGNKTYIDAAIATAVAAVSAGELVLIERHVAATDETSYTFSGLDGNTHEVYVLSWHVIKATTANNELQLQPNGSGSNLAWAGAHSINGAGMTGMGTLTRWFLNQNNSGNASEPMCGEASFFCKTIGTTRRLIRILGTDLEGPTGLFTRDMSGYWDDLTTNITSLKFLSTVASGIKTGSVISLYKRKSG